LSPHPIAAGQARRFVEQALAGWGSVTSRDCARLLVSELVTSTVEHAGRFIEVCVALEDEEVRITVRDGSADSPRRCDVDTEADFGRGLVIVNHLSDGWGVDPSRDGKVVWFSVRSAR
jgi:anti-sigma regulatory factor (Ser/Thr protein kinase)